MPPVIDPAAMAGHDPAAPVIALAGATMGTAWRVLYAARGSVTPGRVRAAIEGRLADLVAQMSHWEASSTLSRFNRAAPGEWAALEPDFARVVGAGLKLARQSGGAFDPAIGRLTDLWGFGPQGAAPLPSPEAVGAARAAGGWQRLDFNAEQRRLHQPGGLSLDLSGIAKGYAVDAVADLLAAMGIRHCLIEIGGELVGRGLRPDGDPWWVDLENPPGVTLPPLRIALHQIAVATSGSYVRGAHSIDPRTGYAATNRVVSVSVIAATAMEADALATAITILYPDLTPLDPLRPAARIVTAEAQGPVEMITPLLDAMMR
ncbi:FAD:protein FMN transferase [Sphingomonas sp. IW22]|uniref:FAD:protein FMN transferase n=1 Tax=Sphingomonas sp. IW22 TaxID=3242489 RepID=UPI0035219914